MQEPGPEVKGCSGFVSSVPFSVNALFEPHTDVLIVPRMEFSSPLTQHRLLLSPSVFWCLAHGQHWDLGDKVLAGGS